MRVDGVVNPVPERVPLKEQGVKPTGPESGRAGREGYAGEEEKASGRGVLTGHENNLNSRRSTLDLQREELKNRLEARDREERDEKDESLLDRLNGAVREMNEEARIAHLSYRFRLHEDSERWMVQIVDILEDEVIREIPPENVLDLSARVQDLVGLMLDQRR